LFTKPPLYFPRLRAGFFLACYDILVYDLTSRGPRRMNMDTTKWKSVLVPREVYEEIKGMAKSEGRTISGQLRLVFEWYKSVARDTDGSKT